MTRSLQEELNELREIVQAICDYVGHAQVAAAVEANRKARESAKSAQGATMDTEKTTP